MFKDYAKIKNQKTQTFPLNDKKTKTFDWTFLFAALHKFGFG